MDENNQSTVTTPVSTPSASTAMDPMAIKDSQIEQLKQQINSLNVQLATLQVQLTNKDIDLSKTKAMLEVSKSDNSNNSDDDDNSYSSSDYVDPKDLSRVAMEMF